jgi:hypothetical protein
MSQENGTSVFPPIDADTLSDASGGNIFWREPTDQSHAEGGGGRFVDTLANVVHGRPWYQHPTVTGPTHKEGFLGQLVDNASVYFGPNG